MNEDSILTISELSDYLKISKSLIRNLVSNGDIPYFRIHRRILFKLNDIKEWIEMQ